MSGERIAADLCVCIGVGGVGCAEKFAKTRVALDMRLKVLGIGSDGRRGRNFSSRCRLHASYVHCCCRRCITVR